MLINSHPLHWAWDGVSKEGSRSCHSCFVQSPTLSTSTRRTSFGAQRAVVLLPRKPATSTNIYLPEGHMRTCELMFGPHSKGKMFCEHNVLGPGPGSVPGMDLAIQKPGSNQRGETIVPLCTPVGPPCPRLCVSLSSCFSKRLTPARRIEGHLDRAPRSLGRWKGGGQPTGGEPQGWAGNPRSCLRVSTVGSSTSKGPGAAPTPGTWRPGSPRKEWPERLPAPACPPRPGSAPRPLLSTWLPLLPKQSALPLRN